MNASNPYRVIIVGGGTAGWMAAAAISKSFGDQVAIQLVESEQIGTVGVGEATIPPIKNFHLLLELDEAEFLSAVNGTFKLGIEFVNWGRLGERYFHPFGPPGIDSWAAQFHHYWLRARELGESADIGAFSVETSMARAGKFGTKGERPLNYAYHFDAGLYATLLRRISEGRGVNRIEGKVVDVSQDADTGDIESIRLESGEEVAGDLFIDCTGFRGLLIEQALEAGWDDWSHWLRSDRAVAVQTERVAEPKPFTRSTARSCGWQWHIPLQNRVGNGLVYCSDYMSEDEATKSLLDNVDGKTLIEPRVIRFATGRRKRQWVRNCVAIGLSSGFLEPLESTSIHLIQNSVIRLIKLFPVGRIRQSDVDQFNREAEDEINYIRDFIILHYHVNQRTDADYWRECREMSVPDSLAHKIDLFRDSAKIFMHPGELFADQSWLSVMLGQGIEPQGYHPIVDNASEQELKDFVTRIKSTVRQIVDMQPSHAEHLRACQEK